MEPRRAYALLGVVLLFWAGNFPLGKLALEHLGPLTLTGGRALLAAPLLLLVAGIAARRWRPRGGAD
jgi:drug/metabolite transporter (DMT)-like permease